METFWQTKKLCGHCKRRGQRTLIKHLFEWCSREGYFLGCFWYLLASRGRKNIQKKNGNQIKFSVFFPLKVSSFVRIHHSVNLHLKKERENSKWKCRQSSVHFGNVINFEWYKLEISFR